MLANKSSNKLHEDIKINYAVGLLQYSKSVWTKVGTLTLYIDIK